MLFFWKINEKNNFHNNKNHTNNQYLAHYVPVRFLWQFLCTIILVDHSHSVAARQMPSWRRTSSALTRCYVPPISGSFRSPGKKQMIWQLRERPSGTRFCLIALTAEHEYTLNRRPQRGIRKWYTWYYFLPAPGPSSRSFCSSYCCTGGAQSLSLGQSNMSKQFLILHWRITLATNKPNQRSNNQTSHRLPPNNQRPLLPSSKRPPSLAAAPNSSRPRRRLHWATLSTPPKKRHAISSMPYFSSYSASSETPQSSGTGSPKRSRWSLRSSSWPRPPGVCWRGSVCGISLWELGARLQNSQTHEAGGSQWRQHARGAQFRGWLRIQRRLSSGHRCRFGIREIGLSVCEDDPSGRPLEAAVHPHAFHALVLLLPGGPSHRLRGEVSVWGPSSSSAHLHHSQSAQESYQEETHFTKLQNKVILSLFVLLQYFSSVPCMKFFWGLRFVVDVLSFDKTVKVRGLEDKWLQMIPKCKVIFQLWCWTVFN